MQGGLAAEDVDWKQHDHVVVAELARVSVRRHFEVGTKDNVPIGNAQATPTLKSVPAHLQSAALSLGARGSPARKLEDLPRSADLGQQK